MVDKSDKLSLTDRAVALQRRAAEAGFGPRSVPPAQTTDLSAVAREAEAMLHSAYLDACKQAGRALHPADLLLPAWAELMLAETFEQIDDDKAFMDSMWGEDDAS